jgi:hypothetical protein
MYSPAAARHRPRVDERAAVSMRLVIYLFGIAGFAAVTLRAAFALLNGLRGGVESLLARDLTEIRARRGDLTGVQEANELQGAARRHRLLALGAFSMWTGLLVVPPLTPWPGMLYAAYSVLWLVPRRRGAPTRR